MAIATSLTPRPQARAWEEQSYQLRPNPRPGHSDALTVSKRRPNMTQLTLLVPYDFTDTLGPKKSDQDRSHEAVPRRREDVPGALSVTAPSPCPGQRGSGSRRPW
jgi:hypothetical protein